MAKEVRMWHFARKVFLEKENKMKKYSVLRYIFLGITVWVPALLLVSIDCHADVWQHAVDHSNPHGVLQPYILGAKKGFGMFALAPIVVLFVGAVFFVVVGPYRDCCRYVNGEKFRNSAILGGVASLAYLAIIPLYYVTIRFVASDVLTPENFVEIEVLWTSLLKPYLFACIVSALLCVSVLLEYRLRSGSLTKQ